MGFGDYAAAVNPAVMLGLVSPNTDTKQTAEPPTQQGTPWSSFSSGQPSSSPYGGDPMMNLYNMAKRREQRQDQDVGENALQAQLFRNPAPPPPMPDQIPPRPMAQRPQGGMQARMQQEGLIGG